MNNESLVRKKQKEDNDNIQEAYDLLNTFFCSFKNIEANIWVGAMFSHIADCYIESNVNYELFMKEMSNFISHSKVWFEQKKIKND